MRSISAFLMAFGLIVGLAVVEPAFAQDAKGDVGGATKDKIEKDKAQKKKDKHFNREIQYRRVVGPNVLAMGPFSISLFVKGQPYESSLRVAVEAVDQPAKTRMETDKWAINGIIYPLAVKLFEEGRPGVRRIRAFKEEVYSHINARYPDLVKDIYIEKLM